MQKTLLEFAQSTMREVARGKQPTTYYCVNCVLDMNDIDANKFETRMFKKKIRVVLKPIAGTNLLVCPRCGSQHFNRDFDGSKNKHYRIL